MENSKIRLAISLAIDRQGYVDTIYNRYYPAWDYTPPTITVQGLPYNSYESGTITELLEQYPDDESKRELLKEGLAEIGYEYDDLSDVVINYTDKSYSSTDQARIEYLRQNLENVLGITVETVQTTLESSYMVDGNYDITTSTWTSTSPYSSLRNFEKNGKALLAGFYENDEVQALYDSTVGVTDPAEIVRIYKEIETRLVSEAVVAPIYWGDTRYFIQNYVQGADIRTVSSTNDFSRAYILEH